MSWTSSTDPGTARREEGCEQLVHSPALDARDCARRREGHLDREGRERGEVVRKATGKIAAALMHVFDARLAIGASARPAIALPLFSIQPALANVSVDFPPGAPRVEARSSYRFAPPTVNPDETTVARWYDDRTRRACVTRGEGSCEARSTAREGRSLGRNKKASKRRIEAQLSWPTCESLTVPSGVLALARVGIDEKFLFLFGSGRSTPVCPGWMSRPVRRRRGGSPAIRV